MSNPRYSPYKPVHRVLASLFAAGVCLLVVSEASAKEIAKPDGEKPKTGVEAIQPETEKCPHTDEKAILGATAEFAEELSGYRFLARVDTGATTCSIHAEKIRIPEGVEIEKPGSKKMMKNIGRKITFELVDAKGNRKRVESTIADTVRVKTSERKERRYKVWLTLRHGDIKRRVHVTLNDRSHMEYPLLIGRNFLCGQFLVDVERKKTPMPPEKKKAVAAKSEAEEAAKEG